MAETTEDVEVKVALRCNSSGCRNTSDAERILKCTFPGCDMAYCTRCFEQISHPDAHEFAFVCEGQEGQCLAEALWECQEENIAYCDDCFKEEHKGRRKSHSKLKLVRKKPRTSTDSGDVSVFDIRLVQELKHELVAADEEHKWVRIVSENWQRFKENASNEYCPVISFIGSTGCGKSFLVQSFTGDEDGPRVAPLGQKGSTSANIHLFRAPGYDANGFSIERLLLLDCEGDSGTVPDSLQSRWLPLQKVTKKLHFSLSPNRTHIVKEEFPRLAYLISDVIVFLETVDFTRIQDYLSKFQKFIDATQRGVMSADTPSLLIVQNKVDPVAVNNRLSVSEATEDFMNMAFPFASREKKKSNHRRKKSHGGRKSPSVQTPEEEAEAEKVLAELAEGGTVNRMPSPVPESVLMDYLSSDNSDSGESKSRIEDKKKRRNERRERRLSDAKAKDIPAKTRNQALEQMKERIKEKGEEMREILREKAEDFRDRLKDRLKEPANKKKSSEEHEETAPPGVEPDLEQRRREDTIRLRDFEASFDSISCVRIPNYRFTGSIENNLKSFRDEVKKMVNRHYKKRQINGTHYSESLWMEIVKELVNSCTSLTSGGEIRMAQIVGRVLQPASGGNIAHNIYSFFDLIYEKKNKENYIKMRDTAFEYLAILIATDLRKTGTSISKDASIDNNPVKIMCDRVFDESDILITGLKPCEYLYKKMTCSQQNKDHGQLHRFGSSTRKKKGQLIFNEDETVDARREKFFARVRSSLSKFHRKPATSIQKRYRLLTGLGLTMFKDKPNKTAFAKCLLCLSNPNESILVCRHSFCTNCINEMHAYSLTTKKPQSICCPLCDKQFEIIKDHYQIPGLAGYRILCLDGGGSRGIIEIAILSKIMERFPKLEVRHLFDLVVGTSTGAIVSAALCLKKRPLESLDELYRKLCRQVFKKSVVQKLGLLRYAYLLFGAKTFYNINDLEQVLKDQLGDELDFIDTMKDSDTPKVAVLATNYSATMTKQIFANYLYPSATTVKDKELREHAEEFLCGEVKIYQAVIASAAAPVYFHPFRIGDSVYVDGALIANNPTEIAYKEAQTLWKERPLDYILSIGTGKPPEEEVKNNFLSWTTTLVNRATDPEIIHQREKERFTNKANTEGRVNNYFRLNPPNIGFDLDATSEESMNLMIKHTKEYLETPRIMKKIHMFGNFVIAKAYYITAAANIKPNYVEKRDTVLVPDVTISFTISTRLPEMGEAFVLNFTPLNKSTPSVEKTYEEVLPNRERKITFLTKPGAKLLADVKIIVVTGEVPLDISGSPFTIAVPYENELVKSLKRMSVADDSVRRTNSYSVTGSRSSN